MPRMTDDEKLAALEKRKADIKAQQLRINRELRAVQSRKKSKARSDDTHAKIVIGAFCKEHAIRNPGSEVQQVVRRGIERHLALRPDDRPLFADLLALWDAPAATSAFAEFLPPAPAETPEAAE